LVAEPAVSSLVNAPSQPGLFGQLLAIATGAAPTANAPLYDQIELTIVETELNGIESTAVPELAGLPVPLPIAISLPQAPPTPPTSAETQSRAEQLELRLPALPRVVPETPLLQPEIPAAPVAAAGARTLAIGTEATLPAAAILTATRVLATNVPPASTTIARNALVPPPAPIVSDLLPRAPATPPPPRDPAPPPEAPQSAPPVPQSLVGDRPSNASDKFAAIISTANRLAAHRTAASGQEFAQAVAAASAPSPPGAAVPGPATAGRFEGSTLESVGEGANVSPLRGEPAVILPSASGTRVVAEGTVGVFSSGGPTERSIPAPTVERDLTETPRRLETTAGPAWTMAPGVSGPPDSTRPGMIQTAVSPTASPAAQLADGVVAHVRTPDADGKVEFHLRLDPPELGRVRVHLVSSGEELSGHVVVADDAVRRLIESQLPELRQRLEAAGLAVQHFDVSADSDRGGRRGRDDEFSFDAPPQARTPIVPSWRARQTIEAGSTAGRLDVVV
jgi:hypothetical protein